MTSNGNLESALAGGISKGIREGVGGAIADGLVGLATLAVLGLAIFQNILPDASKTGDSSHGFEPIRCILVPTSTMIPPVVLMIMCLNGTGQHPFRFPARAMEPLVGSIFRELMAD